MTAPIAPRTVATVGLLLVDGRGWILLQFRDGRSIYPYHWGTIGGSVEEGETIDAALRREVLEETGYVLSHPVVLGARGTIVLVDGEQRDVSLFVAPYDASQRIRCHEGLQITFVDPATLDSLPIYPGQQALIVHALGEYQRHHTAD